MNKPEDREPEPFKECPQFDSCSVNQCPLDPMMLIKQVLAADREQKCRTWRSTRVAIAARYPADLLPTGGLTLSEVGRDKRAAAAKARWDSLSPEEQAAKREVFERGRAALAARRVEAAEMPGAGG